MKEQLIKALMVINSGSSSIKFAIYQITDLKCLCHGHISSIQSGSAAQFEITLNANKSKKIEVLTLNNHQQAIDAILEWIAQSGEGWHLCAAGHRVVHGGAARNESVLVNTDIMQELQALEPLAPLHQPNNLSAIASIAKSNPTLPQVACFDTAFHTYQDDVQQLLPLPKKYRDKGLRRYGFHGLSFNYLVGELNNYYQEIVPTNVVIAHLGNGASICAVKDGKSAYSSMSFSTLDGLLMGTRSGAIDAGALLYLMQTEGLNVNELSQCLYEQSGLLGLSGISSDVRDLEASNEPTAHLALDYYVDSIVKHIVTAASVLQGFDALVFSGGVGENSAFVREQVLAKLQWLGLDIDLSANQNNNTQITTLNSSVKAWVIKTDEELVIARETQKHLISS